MKKLFFILAVIMTVQINMAQTIHRNGNNFVAESVKTSKSSGIGTKYTYTDTDGKTYSIWLNKDGRAYIIRISKKSGKEYKKFLTEEISKEICNEMGIKYSYQKKERN